MSWNSDILDVLLDIKVLLKQGITVWSNSASPSQSPSISASQSPSVSPSLSPSE